MSIAASATAIRSARYLAVIFATQIALGNMPLRAEVLVDMADVSVEQCFAEVANSVCLRQISGEISFGFGIEADTLLMSEAGLMFGIPPGTVQRLGREGVQLLA
jgi:hypothetical protein